MCSFTFTTGRWADSGVFRSYLDELLAQQPLRDSIGAYSVSDISRVQIYSHSGGYFTIGNMATVGGMGGIVRELALLDSLYADFDQFDAFVEGNINSFGTGYDNYRFTTLYTPDGGTMGNNVAMSQRAEGWVSAANCTNILWSDSAHAVESLSSDLLSKYSLVFQLTDLSHNDVPREFFYDILVGAGV